MTAQLLPAELLARLDAIARTPVLLVATDFDGTLAPIDPDPYAVRPEPRAYDALQALARLPRTHAAVVSGRALADLVVRVGAPGIRLAGSHGGELDVAAMAPLDPEQIRRLAEATAIVRRHAATAPCAIVETKPGAVGFHFRRCEPAFAARAVAAIRAGIAAIPALRIRDATQALELSVVDADKGRALRRIQRELAATAVVMAGDDGSDEDAFAALGPDDLGVKIGEGATRAAHRLASREGVAPLFEQLLARRRAAIDAAR